MKTSIVKRWNVEEVSLILFISTALDPNFKLIKYSGESLKTQVTELVTSYIERLVGDIDCTMADFDYTMVDDDTLGESSSQSLTQEQPPVIKRQKSQHLTFYWDQRKYNNR